VLIVRLVCRVVEAWVKSESKRRGKRMCVLLEDIFIYRQQEDMRAAYEKVHGSSK
jgi:hypothetical protein